MESPHNSHKQTCVCVCVCVWDIYIYIYSNNLMHDMEAKNHPTWRGEMTERETDDSCMCELSASVHLSTNNACSCEFSYFKNSDFTSSLLRNIA